MSALWRSTMDGSKQAEKKYTHTGTSLKICLTFNSTTFMKYKCFIFFLFK